MFMTHSELVSVSPTILNHPVTY